MNEGGVMNEGKKNPYYSTVAEKNLQPVKKSIQRKLPFTKSDGSNFIGSGNTGKRKRVIFEGVDLSDHWLPEAETVITIQGKKITF